MPIHPSSPQPTVLFLPESFPFNETHEESFIVPEIPAMLRAFPNVTIAPESTGGARMTIPSTIQVETGLADFLRLSMRQRVVKARLFARVLWSAPFWQDVIHFPALLVKPRSLLRLIGHLTHAHATADWIEGWFTKTQQSSAPVLIYTFWFSATTTGALLVKRRHHNLRVITRAHGIDLYSWRHPDDFLPARRWCLHQVDHVSCISEHGRSYLVTKYPFARQKVDVSRLGITDPHVGNPVPDDRHVTFVTCGSLIPVKQVDRWISALALIAAERPNQQFRWQHIGDGSLRSDIQAQAERELPPNVIWQLLGAMENAAVMDHYAREPIHLFVNTSASEGLPVTMMEALACGIPLAGPAVGGIPEIINPAVGCLFEAPVQPVELLKTLLPLIDHPETLRALRQHTRAFWQAHFDAAVTRPSFFSAAVALWHTV